MIINGPNFCTVDRIKQAIQSSVTMISGTHCMNGKIPTFRNTLISSNFLVIGMGVARKVSRNRDDPPA